MDMMGKLEILADAAKYDVACTSSGVARRGEKGSLGAASSAGCCHAFSADGRCITLLKVLLSNDCSYDCAYCVNRRSNDVPRASFTPRELADLTVAFYRRNYIEGLFLSSGVVGSPDRTMELIIEAARILREEERFRGYIHAKSIPGASPELVLKLGQLVDRLSINIELPTQNALDALAPQKAALSVVKPMRLISEGIQQSEADRALMRRRRKPHLAKPFAPAGQSTQLIVGATPETDQHILQLAESMYKSLRLKRVFYSAYLPVNDDPRLPGLQTHVPLTREHRLYQADWLLRQYGFEASELLSPQDPDLDLLVDPKASWALAHMDLFPVEANTASYEELLRVPGLGVLSARRIVRARKSMRLGFDELKRLGVSFKRSGFFITCNGRMLEGFCDDPAAARASMEASARSSGAGRISRAGVVEGQLSLFEESYQQARDPLSTLERGDVLLAAARAKRLDASAATRVTPRVLRERSSITGATPSGLPQADALVELCDRLEERCA